jgi:hypothetical protein
VGPASFSLNRGHAVSSTRERNHQPVSTVALELIASFGHDPELYVPDTVSLLSGTRTMTWRTSCSRRCPHPDARCHRSNAAWLNHEAMSAFAAVSRHHGARTAS